MERPNTVAGLIEKRRELVARLKLARDETRTLTCGIDAIDVVLKLFAPEIVGRTAKPMRLPIPHAAGKGEMQSIAFELLRNHTLEVQEVVEIADPAAAAAFGLALGSIVVSIHCGSRGLGHQIATDFQREMAIAMPDLGISVPNLDLACAPIRSELGANYSAAMRTATNCAFANRQIITPLTRRVFGHFFPAANLELLFDVSHNTCKQEMHMVAGHHGNCWSIARVRRVLSHQVTSSCRPRFR